MHRREPEQSLPNNTMSHADVVSTDISSEERKDEDVGKKKFTLVSRLKSVIQRHFLSIGIVLSVILGIYVPQPGVYLNEWIHLGNVCFLVMMFTIGLQLQFRDAKSAIKSYRLVLLGLILVLVVRPICAVNILNQIKQFGPLIGKNGGRTNTSSNNSAVEEMPSLGPEEFRLALHILSMCPSPIDGSMIMVTAANGDRGLSILVSTLGHILTVFVTPPMLVWLIPTLKDVHIEVAKVMLYTFIWILLPIGVGRSLRFLSPVKSIIKKCENSLGYLVMSSLVTIFLVKISETSASGHLERISVMNIACMTALGTVLTALYTIALYVILSILPWFSKESTVALSLLSCLINALIAFIIIDALPEGAGDKGLLALPGIFVGLAVVIIVNCVITLIKVPENVSEDTKEEFSFEESETEATKESKMNSKVNEVAAFSIYTDEISVN